ncbi:Outer membrane protein TolC [Aquiflexum balticum DSM 16537]|uniref:Outer membrane protein TolC n=1 Tax=Aquiflexum balticum DSM 16537 TaxID=758820 RepID=A0A1W2H201_9BACT|nr:TolC family protein [Aquiflexum balticum]SMD42997.1 Outer membrane protein TolC [Aquiflexum balticum DSM 16537]
MRKLLLTFALTGLSFSFVFAQGTEPLDLEKAVLIGLERNYGIKIASNNVVIAERDVKIGVGTFFMPTLTGNFLNSFNKDDVKQQFANSPEPNEIPGARTENENYSLVGFYGFRPEAIFTVQRLGKLAEVSELQAKVLVENTVAAISSAYYRLVLELQRHKVLETTLELSQSRLDIAKAQYDLGGAGKRDYLTAQVDYNSDLSLLVNQDLIIQNARINLNELLALTPDREFSVKDTITVDKNLLLEDLLENAYLNNKQYLATQRMENVAFLALKETQAERLPQINLNASFNRNTFTSEAGFLLLNQRTGFNYGLTASLNLFSGFTLNRRIQNARVEKLNAEYALQDLEILMVSDIQRAYNTYNTNIKLLDIEYSNYKTAIENADIALERFRLGISDYLQFRDAQVNLLTAENRLLTALFNIKEMEIELMRLSGRIYFQESFEEFRLGF